MKNTTKLWLDDAGYDIEAAEAMLKDGRYFFVVSICHGALEKALKAVWIERLKGVPPGLDRLDILSRKALAESMPGEFQEFMNELDGRNADIGYPEGRRDAEKKLTHCAAENILFMSKEIFALLKERVV